MMPIETYVCIQPDCRFRFSLKAGPERPERVRCPRCGSDTEPDDAVPDLRVPERAPNHGSPALTVVLDNLRSALNVGSIFRTADAVGAGELVLLGTTPTPLNPKIAKTALGAEKTVPWRHDWNSADAIARLKSEGCEIWALEGGETAENLFAAFPGLSALEAGNKIALVLGGEVSGVDPIILAGCDRIFYLPMIGKKESLNVAAAFAVAAYLIRFGKMTHGC